MLSQLKQAAQTPPTNPDHYLDQLSTHFAEQLKAWAANPAGPDTGPGCLAAGEHRPLRTPTAQHILAGKI
jgi:hypothetical protein